MKTWKILKFVDNYKYYFLIFFIILTFLIYRSINRDLYSIQNLSRLPKFNADILSQFNGDDLSKPVYIAYEGYVYDVSSGREDFYNDGKDYHYLAGKDSTIELNMVGGAIIKEKYQIIGIYTQ